MTDRMDSEALSRMIAGAAARIRAEHAWLSELDSVVGDGDHGTAMLRIVDCLEKTFADKSAEPFKARFARAGWNVMDTDGGASSSLLGLFFMGMAGAMDEQASSLDGAGIARAFAAGLTAVCKQTTARRGDKTMMDALIPAIDVFTAAVNNGKKIVKGLEEAAQAARSGSESTTEMTAHHGRARFAGEKSHGHQDPGSASIALMFEGFCVGLSESQGEAPPCPI
jgi:phosphoenolpyruvate---glycerone phosphotransferase subunit DhaL